MTLVGRGAVRFGIYFNEYIILILESEKSRLGPNGLLSSET